MLIFPFSGASFAAAYRFSVIIFLGHEEFDWPEISSRFEAWAKFNVVPPKTLLVTSSSHAKKLSEAIGNGSAADYLDVLGKSELAISGFDHAGQILKLPLEASATTLDITEYFKCAVTEFMTTASKRGDVVVAAPPGFYFAKQSERYSSHFLRAESLLSGTSEIELLSIAILGEFSKFCDREHAAPKVRVFIDSMAIWPVAQMLVNARRAGKDDGRRYSIESFHGYEGLASWQPLPGPAFVIISASTSGGLEATVRKKLGQTKDVPIVTLIGLAKESGEEVNSMVTTGDRSFCLYRVDRKLTGEPALDGLRADFLPNVLTLPPGAESVRVIGERFLSHNNKPKLARLTYKSLTNEEKRTLAELAGNHMVLAGRRAAIGSRWWSLSFDVGKLMERYAIPVNGKGYKLQEWVYNYAAAGPTAVIYAKDLTSGGPFNQRLAEQVAKVLGERAPGTPIKVIEHTQLENPDASLSAFLKSAAAIVSSPILSNGFTFKQISAMLRIVQGAGPRLYIALAVLPESHARLKELSSDLGSNSADSAYRFKYAFALPIGRVNKTIQWDKEVALLDEVFEVCEDSNIKIPPQLSQRRQAMQASNGLSDTFTFLPSSNGMPLSVSAGFLLWDEERIAGDDFGAGVLLTVASFLEASRRARSGDPETSLRSGVFQHTLIEPATFTRFNDGAIQAALLRAAYASELDYSVDREASRDMARLIAKFIELHNTPAGSAAPEFVLALLLNKLTLHRDDVATVLKACTSLTGWFKMLAEKLAHA